jgi:protein-disulfide isomerase
MGLDEAKFDAALVSGPVKTAVQNDVMAGKAVIAQFVPAVFVDGKYVERWQSDTSPILERIIDYAVKHPGE